MLIKAAYFNTVTFSFWVSLALDPKILSGVQTFSLPIRLLMFFMFLSSLPDRKYLPTRIAAPFKNTVILLIFSLPDVVLFCDAGKQIEPYNILDKPIGNGIDDSSLY